MEAWNKGKRVGQKKAFKLEDIWRIRIRLELEKRLFELALFNLAIDSKLRSCSLRNLRLQDVSRSGCVMSRTIVKQVCKKAATRLVRLLLRDRELLPKKG